MLVSFVLFIAAGCGNAGETATGSPAAAASGSSAVAQALPAEPSSSAEPAYRTVETIKGEIRFPANPQRIIAEEYLGSLIALDIIPVGAPGLTLKNFYYKEALAGVVDTGEYGKLNAERISSLDPELIITGSAESYEVLSKIAPTLLVPYGDLKDAHEELTFFGKALGKEKEAQAWLAEYDRRIAEAKAKVDAAIGSDASFSILERTDKAVWAYGDNFGRGGQAVYQALSRQPPKAIATSLMEKQWVEISAEALNQYAGDYLIVTANNRTVEDFRKDSIWGSLPAVKNNRLYVWPEARSWYYDPIAVLAQTEELAKWLTELPVQAS